MTLYILDTNVVSEMIHGPAGSVALRIAEVADSAVSTSIVVAGELRFGAERKGSPKLTARVEEALELIPVLPLGGDADRYYGRLRADLERRGTPISANDMLIAAHTLSLGATLVTNNVREFVRVEGLEIENWLRA